MNLHEFVQEGKETKQKFLDRTFWVFNKDKVLVWRSKRNEGKPETWSFRKANMHLNTLPGETDDNDLNNDTDLKPTEV